MFLLVKWFGEKSVAAVWDVFSMVQGRFVCYVMLCKLFCTVSLIDFNDVSVGDRKDGWPNDCLAA